MSLVMGGVGGIDVGQPRTETKPKPPTRSPGIPEWAVPDYWRSAPTPATSNSSRSGAASSGYGFTVSPINFERARGAGSSVSLDDAWNQLTSGAGIDYLSDEYGVPTNWWPGVMIPNYDQLLATSWSEPGTREAMIEPWAAPSRLFDFTDPATGEKIATRWVRYDPAQAAQQYMAMGGAERAKYSQMMADAGMVDPEWGGLSEFDPTLASAFGEALAWANYWGQPIGVVLKNRAELYSKLKGRRGGSGRGSGAGPVVKVEVPSYETLVEEAKALLRNNLGRDPADWEMTLLADEMQRQHGSWADATKARMIGGNGTYEIPDPNALSQRFVETTWEDELTRLEEVGDTSNINQMLIAAATKGAEMMGGTG